MQTLRNRYLSEYGAWKNAIGRCFNPRTKQYADYGGRGISVCPEWNLPYPEGFENFLASMGAKPSPELTLDRMDNDGNYEPTNCRWATRTQQVANRRSFAGPGMRGEENFGSKLTDTDVRAIRASNERRKVLAMRYNVTIGTIDDIRAKRRWKHL